MAERTALESEIIRKCLSRSELQCSFMDHMHYRLVYRRYASLFIILAVDQHENELAALEFIHAFVETLDRYFHNVVRCSCSLLSVAAAPCSLLLLLPAPCCCCVC